LLAAVAEAAFGVGGFVFREEPEADGNLRAVEELAGATMLFFALLRTCGVVSLLENALSRRAVSTRSASMRARRMSPSPDWLEDMLPLARTKPAMPCGAMWWIRKMPKAEF